MLYVDSPVATVMTSHTITITSLITLGIDYSAQLHRGTLEIT